MYTVVPDAVRGRRRSRTSSAEASPEPQRPRLVAALGSRHDLAATAELLECQQADRFLAERSLVTGLGRLEQAARDLVQAIGRHAPPHVVDGDHGADRDAAGGCGSARRRYRLRHTRRPRWRRTR